MISFSDDTLDDFENSKFNPQGFFSSFIKSLADIIIFSLKHDAYMFFYRARIWVNRNSAVRGELGSTKWTGYGKE